MIPVWMTFRTRTPLTDNLEQLCSLNSHAEDSSFRGVFIARLLIHVHTQVDGATTDTEDSSMPSGIAAVCLFHLGIGALVVRGGLGMIVSY